MTANDRSHETIINDTLARLLRDRLGMDAVAETLRGPARPDVIVRLGHATVVIEVEIEPAPTVEADALARLGMDIDGQIVENVFAVTVPGPLRSTAQQHLYDRMAIVELEWQEWRSDGSSGPKSRGRVTELAQSVSLAAPPAGDLDRAVDVLDEGARRAGSRLYQSPGTIARVSNIFGADPTDEVANMAALVVINAMVFQERLASGDETYRPMSAARRRGSFSRLMLLRIWEEILAIDYYPIFSIARSVVQELSDVEATTVLEECAETAATLLGMEAVGRHDLAGRIFNRLVSERKLLAAFYTSIPASTLLAGLALSPERWTDVDWDEPEKLSRLRVIDPACGTGTLLMAAYRQMLQNHVASDNRTLDDTPALHRSMVEDVIAGADVVQAAIHLTAATLAAMSPSVRFERMGLHTFRLGRDEDGRVHLGSLEWLVASEIQSSFSGTEESIGATTGEGSIVHRPQVDLVISNPPYTRRGSDGGSEEAITRVFSLPEGDQESQRAIARRTSAVLRGTPANQIAGHASSFTALADRLVNRGGRIALVLPVTALAGESWSETRAMLSSRYEIEFVVSSHDPERRSMSYDTAIAETLVVARRLHEAERPSGRGRFVNLWRTPTRETDALALVSAVNSASSTPVLSSDGPPVGGSPLMVGGEQWGEIVDGPVGEAPWKSSRWKHALTGQFAAALERGELWSADGMGHLAHIPIAVMGEVCDVGPQDRQIRGSLGVFDSYHGWNERAQFHAVWRHRESSHQSMLDEPNAWLVPKANRDHTQIWSQSGTLQVTRDFRYDSQRVMATRTNVRALGVRAWFTLQMHETDRGASSRQEIVIALWCNSTLGILLHANHANRAQQGRGTGSKGMLESLRTLDVRQLQPWQLEEAQSIWQDLSNRKLESFHKCAVDPARIELDDRIVRDMLGLGGDAVATVARLRTLLAVEPSIHGSKRPELPEANASFSQQQVF